MEKAGSSGAWVSRVSRLATGMAIVTTLAGWGGLRGVQADLLHLKSGAAVDIGWDYRVDGEKLHFKLEGGWVAVPMSDVQRIEKTERKQREERVVPERASAPAEAAPSRPAPPESFPPGQGEPRERLAEVAADALELIRSMEPSESLSQEDRETGLKQTVSWSQEVRIILEEKRTESSDPDKTAAAEDLSRVLRKLEDALQDGDVEMVQDLKQTLEDILTQLETPVE